MDNDEPLRFALAVHSVEISRRFQECLPAIADEIHTRVISFEEAVPETRKLLDEEGYDVVLCHGGTGQTIAGEIGQGVVLIQKMDIDVIKALIRARRLSREAALTIHAREHFDVVFLQELLDMRIRAVHYATESELAQGVQAAHREGVNIFVGGGVSRAIVERLGSTSIIIEPNEHSIAQALIQARAMARAKREEVADRERLIAILKLLDVGVVFVDNERNLVFVNRRALSALDITAPNPRREDFARHFSELGIDDVFRDGKPRYDALVSLGRQKLVVTTLPVSIQAKMRGAVALIRDTASIRSINNKIREGLRLRGLTARHTLEDIKGSSPAIKRLAHKIAMYAPTCSSVLIEGESGSGKELAAHALHNLSLRRDRPFVAVNCSALPESLLESELFGYEEGAFTGAKRGGKTGLFELANQGTIFLDEIGEISHGVQLRLLRVLEAKEIMRVGGDRVLPVDVRILSASNRRLRELVRLGRFRLDLYYRLGVLQVLMPPLRHRLEDIPALLQDLLARYGKTSESLTQGMMATIRAYDWPGNVRELLAFMESYLILVGEEHRDEALFQDLFVERTACVGEESPAPGGETGAELPLREQLESVRRAIVSETLKHAGMDKRLAASRLGISYNTLWRIMSGDSTPEG